MRKKQFPHNKYISLKHKRTKNIQNLPFIIIYKQLLDDVFLIKRDTIKKLKFLSQIFSNVLK